MKRNGVLLVLLSSITILFVNNRFYVEDSSMKPYIELFAWMIGVFFIFVIGIGLLYTSVCWLYLVVNRKSIEVSLNIGLEDGLKGESGDVPVQLAVSKMMMPLIGYIKIRLIYDDHSISDPILLNTFPNGWKDLLPKQGNSILHLDERKLHNIRSFVISCEDYLQIFQFSFNKQAKKSFYLYPPKLDLPTDDIKPSKSDEMVERIRSSRKVEGDYLNYKDFESGDDVRRIVWKIFAKNKDLMVRIPEIINPYASHVYFFGSFYNDILHDFGSEYNKGMLNFYKDIMYNVCLSLQKTDRKIRFNIDQPVSDAISVDKKDDLTFKLSSAQWQKDLPATDLQVPASEAVLCVSSLIPATDLEELIQKRPVSLFVVRTSKYLDEQSVFNWSNLFLRNESQDELNKLTWLISRTRKKVINNEKKIVELVSSNQFQGQII